MIMTIKKRAIAGISILSSVFITQSTFAFSFDDNSSSSSSRADNQILSVGCNVAQDNVNLLAIYNLKNDGPAPKNKFKHKLGKFGLLKKAYNDAHGNYIVRYSDKDIVPKYFQKKHIIFLPREVSNKKITYATTYCITDIKSNGSMQALQFSTSPYEVSPPLRGSDCGICYYVPSKDILSMTSSVLEKKLTNKNKKGSGDNF
jgi:hypothetical protein